MNRQFACAKAPGIRGDARENTTESKERSLQERSKPAKGREGSSSSSSESQPPSVQTAVEHPDQFHNFYGRPHWRRYASCVLTTALSILICLVPLLSIRLYIECQQPTCQHCIQETSNSIDDSEKPCDNLYEYVCGKYASALNTWFPNAFLRVQVPIFLSFYKKIMLEDAEAVRERQGEDSVSHKAVLMTQRCLFEAYDFGDLGSPRSEGEFIEILEEEEEGDKKAKSMKDDKDSDEADKGKKDDKKGGKDKGGGKGGSKKGSKSGSGGSEGKDKDKEKGKGKGKDKGKDKCKKPSKDKKNKDDKVKDEKGKDGKRAAGKEEALYFASLPIAARSGGGRKLWELEKKKESGGEKPLADISHTDLPAWLGPLSPLEAVQKEGAKKAEKSSDKSLLKSTSLAEKNTTSKTDTTDKSEHKPDDMDQPKNKTSSKVVKSGEPSSPMTVVRTFTSRGPVYADSSFGEDAGDEGGHSCIEIQMLGHQYPVADQRWAAQSQAQPWEQSYRDGASQRRQLPVPHVTTTSTHAQRMEGQVLMTAHNIRRESVERSRPNVDLLQFEQWFLCIECILIVTHVIFAGSHENVLISNL
ncbi:uncharacterized protein LOC144163368 isoform X2 [Haemaphysalis longicornis]